MLLRLDSVSKSFGALKVVDAISLSVAEGETLGIVGPNGAGKTTLFNFISGDLRVDSGTVQFAGREITRCRRTGAAARGWGAPTRFRTLRRHDRVRESARRGQIRRRSCANARPIR